MLLLWSVISWTIELIFVKPVHGGSNISVYAQLRNDILSRDAVVHRVSPDIADPGGPLNVTYNLVLVDVMDIDDVKQLMTVCVYLKVEWIQQYLAWNPLVFDNMTKVNIDTRLLWTPNIIIVVGYGERLNLDLPERASVNWMGIVQVHFETYITFRCGINFQKYPFDIQTCELGIAVIPEIGVSININYTVDEKLFDSAPYTTYGEWRLLSYRGSIRSDTNNQSYPVYSVKVQRRPEYYVITVIGPLILTSAMISLVFLIPPGSGEKISFFVTLYTSLTIFSNFIGNVMPRNLSSAPYLILLLVGVFVQGLLANLATLFVVNIYQKEKQQKNCGNCKRRSSKSCGKVAPLEIVLIKQEDQSEYQTKLDGMEVKPKMTSYTSILTSSQWDKLFFVLFSSAEVLLLGMLFGVTDWLSDAPPFGL